MSEVPLTPRVMTFNLGDGLAPPEKVVALLRSQPLDIVALEELVEPVAQAIERDLADRFPYQALHPAGIPGKGLLSRFPIAAKDHIEANPGRPDLLATLDVGGHPIAVIVAHPPPPKLTCGGLVERAGTRDQIERLLAEIAAVSLPLLLLGDLNVTPRHALYRRLAAAGLIDAFRAAGHGRAATYPTRLTTWTPDGYRLRRLPVRPVLRLDYIWASHHWRPLDAHLGPDAGSDHLPLIATLQLR